ncbi:MAG: NRDE family protein [Ekhidna sp.]|nr:NRDE family protein [Ekhidna sp.]
MCLITFAYDYHPKYKFILAANRDEFYHRRTAAAQWWEDQPNLFGGRDLQAKGTWMGINRNGRFAALTNYRDLANIKSNAKSRGDLPVNFLTGHSKPEAYASIVQREGDIYNGFNLITLDSSMSHVSNYSKEVSTLRPGIYGLSNALLDTPWPKVLSAKERFQSLITSDFVLSDLIEVMQNEELAKDEDLPQTGLDYDREKALSAMFIKTSDYGTCCSTAITIDRNDQVSFLERSYPVGDRKDEENEVEFKIEQFA